MTNHLPFFFTGLILFLLGGFAKLNAQQKKIFGNILAEGDVEGIHILNTTSSFYSVTNTEGNFSITAEVQDTLLITSVQYLPEEIVISQELFDEGFVTVLLTTSVNELSEVFIGPRFTGILDQDIQQIPIEESLDFYDVGIPGFRGEPEEKIPKMFGQVIAPTAINIEGLYKHLSGYYKKLRTRRKWDTENNMVSHLRNYYTETYFWDAFGIPAENLEDFLLFCIETSSLQRDFKAGRYGLVLEIFEEKSVVYLSRLSEKKE